MHHRSHRCHGSHGVVDGGRSKAISSTWVAISVVPEAIPDRRESPMPNGIGKSMEMPVSAKGMIPSSRSSQSQQQ